MGNCNFKAEQEKDSIQRKYLKPPTFKSTVTLSIATLLLSWALIKRSLDKNRISHHIHVSLLSSLFDFTHIYLSWWSKTQIGRAWLLDKWLLEWKCDRIYERLLIFVSARMKFNLCFRVQQEPIQLLVRYRKRRLRKGLESWTEERKKTLCNERNGQSAHHLKA